jgi:hypothetical protein
VGQIDTVVQGGIEKQLSPPCCESFAVDCDLMARGHASVLFHRTPHSNLREKPLVAE